MKLMQCIKDYINEKFKEYKKNPNNLQDAFGHASKEFLIYQDEGGYFGLEYDFESEYNKIKSLLDNSIFGKIVKEAQKLSSKQKKPSDKSNSFTVDKVPCYYKLNPYDGFAVFIDTKYMMDNLNKLDIDIGKLKNFNEDKEMNNFSEKLNKLQESLGLEKTEINDFSDTELEDFAKKIKSAKSKLSKDDDLDPKFADTLFEKAKEMGFEFELANGDIKKLIQDPGYVKDIIKADPKNGPSKVERLVQFMIALKNGGSMNFSEDQGVDTQVTDEASARALGESLAKKMWGDKFDQKIFDGVFATALEQCGENWDHVAAYLRKVYQGASKMNNFSERLNSLQESLGLEKTKLETQTPAVTTTATPATETPSAQAEVTRTQEGSSTPAPVQPANLSEKPKTETKETVTEAICPKCGRVPCECVTHTVTLDFSNLTDEEFAEIAKEAKEYAKYPEQYETEGDRIQSFASWLQNSRFKDFCNEALYKAFCGLKK